jgi:hypothetical protein
MMQQATLLAYIDVFRVFAIVALVMAPVALILLRSRPSPKGLRWALLFHRAR